MIGLKIKNGVVDNAAVFDELSDGWIEAPEGVGPGWIDNGDGTFSEPVIEQLAPTIEEQNDDIMAQLDAIDRKSIRPLREGDQIRIDALEAEAATLRSQLQ